MAANKSRKSWPLWTNALILHGTEVGRDEVARELHAAGPAPSGAFVRLDCKTSEHMVQTIFARWLREDGRTQEPALLPIGSDGTLFLDHIERLIPDCQYLLDLFAERLAEVTANGQRRPVGRLIAGTSISLREQVRAGKFLARLYDALDKARIDLRGVARGCDETHAAYRARCRRQSIRH